MDKEYYAVRHGVNVEPLDLPSMKILFLNLFQKFSDKLYFAEAIGYDCVDDHGIKGEWGSNPEVFFFLKLRMHNLWPISTNIETYDDIKLFSVIEFLYDYVSEPVNAYYHNWNNCGWHAPNYDKAKGQARYRLEINKLLKDYAKGYQLTEKGQIEEIPPSGLEGIVSELVVTADPQNIDNRVKSAISKYLRYSATLDDKKDAVRTLADVLEFLKKENIRFTDKDDSDLFLIINRFDIRHHSREQQGQYDKEEWYNWMFYTFLISIQTLLKLKTKYGAIT